MSDALELDVDLKWIERQLRLSGRSQAELGRYLNLKPWQINKRIKGHVEFTAEEVRLVHEFFRTAERTAEQAGAPVDVDPDIALPLRSDGTRSLPIYGSVSAGGRLISMKKPVDYARRPRRLDGREDVFALYVDDEQMSPVFELGELIAAESARPPAPGDNVVVHLKSDETLLRRLVAIDATRVKLKQHNPPAERDITHDEIERIWRVMKVHDLLTG